MVKYEEKSVIELLVNGQKCEVTVRPSDILLEVLRDELGLTGGKPRMRKSEIAEHARLL